MFTVIKGLPSKLEEIGKNTSFENRIVFDSVENVLKENLQLTDSHTKLLNEHCKQTTLDKIEHNKNTMEVGRV